MNESSSGDVLRDLGRAIGPFLVLGSLLIVLYLTSPFGQIEELADADTGTILLVLTGIGLIAGVIPVLIGMLWFPFLKSLDQRWIHAVLSLSAGVLTFAGVEMLGGIVDNVGDAPVLGWGIATVGVAGAYWVLTVVSRWRYRKIREGSVRRGLQVAYIIAIGLGLHSIGEGLAIGTAFVLGDGRLVTLLVIAFLMDNVTEGPTIVAAVASEVDQPALYHFGVMGLIAGGPVIVGGWIGSLAFLPLVAVLFFALGLGAILQVIREVVRFVAIDRGSTRDALTRLNLATFVAGFLLMVLIDEIVIDVILF